VKYWENNRRQAQENAGWSLDYVSAVDSNTQTIGLLTGIATGGVLLCGQMKSWPRFWNSNR
jgi:hypothetical protein